MGLYCVYCIGQFLCRHLPWSIVKAIVWVLANIQFYLSRVDRQTVQENLSVVLGESPTNQQVKQVFYHFGLYLADFLLLTKKVNADFVKEHVHVQGLEYFQQAMKANKGVIIASAHLGNWEMGGAVLSQLGYTVSAVALVHANQRVNNFFNRQREAFGCHVIPTTVAIRHVLEDLRAKKTVAILAERDFNHHGLIMDFLGKPTMIPKGAAAFAMKTGAPLVPAFFIREGDNFKITFHPAIFPDKISGNDDESLKVFLQPYLTITEEYIRKYPTQWLLFRRFWQQ